ncbi:hypothetical protein CFD26_102554 [Aspergillus turcosus]|uniref:Uncharacterized protein n=1 Tax=Aspergillus turcosus TaxID=1245748 RepID=A0A421CUM8_9EURO|nr:hypothetical protein CFD26_102554 [Aspergillus turcosus]
MKFFVTLLLLAATATAAVAAVEAPQAGCSQPGEYCNGGTFLCCNRRKCVENVVSISSSLLQGIPEDGVSHADNVP